MPAKTDSPAAAATARAANPSGVLLPDSVSSPQDVAALVTEVRQYARWASHSLIKQRVTATSSSSQAAATASDASAPELSPAARILLAAWAAQDGGQTLTQARLDELIEELQAIIETAPTLTITLAAPPGNGLKKQLVAWCRANLAPDALVRFSFNATLLGGMVVRFGSHVYDWSFRRQILENRTKIPQYFRTGN